jgi:hypothetical protein
VGCGLLPADAPPAHKKGEPGGTLLASLNHETQARLREMGAGHRTEFGTSRRIQATFDQYIGLIDELISRGADHNTIGELLAAVGIDRGNGSPLPLGTISGALSRARERARASTNQPASTLQPPAAQCMPLQDTAGSRTTAPVRDAQSSTPPDPRGRGLSRPLPRRRKPAIPAARDAADLLNRLRSTSQEKINE